MMLLYQTDLVGGDPDAAIAAFEREHDVAVGPYGTRLVRGVGERSAELDAAVQAHLTDWTVSRLGAVERAVLRIAMLELLEGEVPPPVIIDEAVELAKRYATPDAARLVNGVLAGWLRADASGDEEE